MRTSCSASPAPSAGFGRQSDQVVTTVLRMGSLEAQNKQIVERYWNALARRDWDAMAAMLAPDAHYTDSTDRPYRAATGSPVTKLFG